MAGQAPRAAASERSLAVSLILVCLATAILVQLAGCEARRTSRRSSSDSPASRWGYEDVPKKCGREKFQLWQQRESAFGCVEPDSHGPERSRDRTQAPSEDEQDAEDVDRQDVAHEILGDDGSYLVELKDWFRTCAGTVIYPDLIVTTASCAIISRESREIHLYDTRKSNFSEAYITGDYHKVCYSTNPSGLAVVRLDGPLEEPNLILPACLHLEQQHRDEATCSLVAYGPESQDSYDRNITRIEVRRTYSRDGVSRYEPFPAGQKCEGCKLEGGGGAIFCYDKCLGGETRAYLVGVVTKLDDSVYEAADTFLEVMNAIGMIGPLETPNIKCYTRLPS